jgi:hypothetical protein
MKYKVKQIQEDIVEASGYTTLAIECYRKIKKTEVKLEQLEEELQAWLSQLNREELDAYVKITEQIN